MATAVRVNAHFNPRSPYGERLADEFCLMGKKIFQSTLPLRGATKDVYTSLGWQPISIHAPLTGSDYQFAATAGISRDFNPRSPYGERPRNYNTCNGRRNFNPRSPYGERPIPEKNVIHLQLFQSTLPLRGATKSQDRSIPAPGISIHAPLTGSDGNASFPCLWQGYFNPRSPYGERPPPVGALVI